MNPAACEISSKITLTLRTASLTTLSSTHRLPDVPKTDGFAIDAIDLSYSMLVSQPQREALLVLPWPSHFELQVPI